MLSLHIHILDCLLNASSAAGDSSPAKGVVHNVLSHPIARADALRLLPPSLPSPPEGGAHRIGTSLRSLVIASSIPFRGCAGGARVGRRNGTKSDAVCGCVQIPQRTERVLIALNIHAGNGGDVGGGDW